MTQTSTDLATQLQTVLVEHERLEIERSAVESLRNDLAERVYEIDQKKNELNAEVQRLIDKIRSLAHEAGS